jgi:hypothetical protein
MNSRVVSGYLETFNRPRLSSLNINLENTSEPYNEKKKKKKRERKRIPLPQSSGRRNHSKRAAINENGKQRKRDTGFNPANPSIIKPQLLHDGQQKMSFHFIKNFFHVHFENHKTSFGKDFGDDLIRNVA